MKTAIIDFSVEMLASQCLLGSALIQPQKNVWCWNVNAFMFVFVSVCWRTHSHCHELHIRVEKMRVSERDGEMFHPSMHSVCQHAKRWHLSQSSSRTSGFSQDLSIRVPLHSITLTFQWRPQKRSWLTAFFFFFLDSIPNAPSTPLPFLSTCLSAIHVLLVT